MNPTINWVFRAKIAQRLIRFRYEASLPKKLSVKDNRMSKIDCTVRFCPTCQAETKRNPCGACRPCKARRTAKYRASHPEKVKAGIDAWRIENKTKANASSTSWAAANPEKVLASSAAWKKSNKQAVHIHNQNRRARKRASGGSLSKGLSEKLFTLQRGKCACCKQPLGNDYHLDHIVPLALGGTNTDDNMQLLRQRCNNQKGAKHPVDFMQSRGFLL